uniref:Uncharacterized protein n=1 Tax=Rangifer tarandus platyrhynchus TaxID=3082113 RepID=A0ACB0EI85_RANTA|nr:unnamed protein product [Rangifer tarandus platyrhynchus]
MAQGAQLRALKLPGQRGFERSTNCREREGSLSERREEEADRRPPRRMGRAGEGMQPGRGCSQAVSWAALGFGQHSIRAKGSTGLSRGACPGPRDRSCPFRSALRGRGAEVPPRGASGEREARPGSPPANPAARSTRGLATPGEPLAPTARPARARAADPAAQAWPDSGAPGRQRVKGSAGRISATRRPLA